MAAGLGFIEFTTGDILTAAAANGYLASQTVMVFASSAARASAITSPQEGMFSYLKDTNATEYYTGTAWQALGGGGGKVLQVVFASYATEVGSSSSTYADTGLTASITPSSATSKVLVLVTQQGVSKSAASSATGVKIQLLRGATSILKMGDANANTNSLLLANIGSVSGSYLDSPATTSSTTYKTQFASTNATSQARVQNFDADSAAAVSTITLMEIGA